MRKALSYAALALLVAGCSYVPSIPFVGPHKIDIQQGNYVTRDMVSKLKPGMSRSQVRFVLGTPLIADPFHADRWDYVYVLERKGRIIGKRRVAVIFEEKDGPLLRIEGDITPAKPAVAGDGAPVKPAGAGDVAPAKPAVAVESAK